MRYRITKNFWAGRGFLAALALALLLPAVAALATTTVDITVAVPGSPLAIPPNRIDDILNVGTVGGGVVNQSGGIAQFDVISLGVNFGVSGTYNFGPGSLLDFPSSGSQLIVGDKGIGNFNQTGGTLNSPANAGNLDIMVGKDAGNNDLSSYNQTGGNLNAHNLIVGDAGTNFNFFNQNAAGGSSNNTLTGDLILANTGAGTVGVYSLEAGTLNATNEIVGNQGLGLLSQNSLGGSATNTLSGSLTLGSQAGSAGYYLMNAGSLIFTGPAGTQLIVGDQGLGAFFQNGGTINGGNADVIIGKNAANANQNTFEQTDGDLNARNLIVGDAGTGNNTFNQNVAGGSSNNTLSGSLIIGGQAGSNGIYNLAAGTLIADNEFVGNFGNGVFTQTGGNNNVFTALNLAVGPNVTATYHLNAGNVTLGTAAAAGTVNVNAGANATSSAIFNQAGGNLLNAAAAFPFNFNNLGTFNYSAGTFAGRLRNLTAGLDVNGVVNFNANFTAGNGLFHNSLIPLLIDTGRTVTFNGLGLVGSPGPNLDNQAALIVKGNLNAGAGDLVNSNVGPGLIVGTGLITGNLINQGTIDPGNYLPGTYVGPLDPRPQNQQNGALNFTGNFTQTATGTLVVDVLSPVAYDQMNGIGATTAVLGGTVAPILRGGYIPGYNQVFPNVVFAPGGVTGTFAAVANQRINLVKYWQPEYYPTHVDLRVLADFTGPPCLTPNTWQVANMFNLVGSNQLIGSDLGYILESIANMTSYTDMCNAYGQLTPGKAAILPNLAFVGFHLQHQSLSQRITSLRYGTAGNQLGRFALNYNGMQGMMMAFNSGVGSAVDASAPVTSSRYLDTEGQWAVYTDFNMALGSFTNNSGFAGFDYTMPGFTIGADYRIRNDLIVGVATGYLNTNADFVNSGGNVNGNTWPITFYAAWFPNSAYVFGSIGYSLNLYELKRNISFAGINRVATSSPTGNQFNLYTEAGYDFNINPVTITPVINLAYSHVGIGGFTESGAESLNLRVSEQNVDSLQTGVGACVAVEVFLGGVKFVPQAYAMYVHEFLNSNRDVFASLSSISGSRFNYRAYEPGTDFALLGCSLTTGLSKNLSLNLNFNSQVGQNNAANYNVSAGLRYVF